MLLFVGANVCDVLNFENAPIHWLGRIILDPFVVYTYIHVYSYTSQYMGVKKKQQLHIVISKDTQ